LIVAPARRPSLRAELARVALRWFVRRRSHHQTIEQARNMFRAVEILIPQPPRGTRTTRVDAGGVKAECIATPASRTDRHALYLHGGGYRVGAPATYRHFTWRLANAMHAHLLVIDYRLAPEHPFPAALDDALSAYRWLLAGGAHRLAVIGDSAGGGLALALLMKLRDEGLPLPTAAVALSPWTDLALTGESITSNAAADPMLNADDLPKFAADYLAGTDPRNPYASPIYGNPSGLPPTLLQVGSDEILRDDAVRMADNMQRAKCDVELQIWPRMPHAWHLLAPVLPEARLAIACIGAFVERNMQAQEATGRIAPTAPR
jgi:monoterpene epsilon-lactone hydrolase